MIDLIRKQLSDRLAAEDNIHHVREFLQILLLKILYDTHQFEHVTFVGGTCLRVLHDLNRFSEDLDFSLIQKQGYSFSRLVQQIEHHLKQYNLSSDFKIKEEKTVQGVMIRFHHLLFQLGLSPLKDQNLSIRLEVDTNPPLGGNNEISAVSRYFLFTVTHHDMASLYAGKLSACLYRTYTKGRDFYDLLWYLGKKITPNFLLLNNSIEQTQKIRLEISEKNFYDFLRQKIETVDFSIVQRDVKRFLVDKKEAEMLRKEVFLSLLK